MVSRERERKRETKRRMKLKDNAKAMREKSVKKRTGEDMSF